MTRARSTSRYAWLAVCVCLIAMLRCAHATEPDASVQLSRDVQLNSHAAGALIGRQMQFLEDPSGRLTLEQVLAMSAKPTPNFSFTHSVYWFHVRMENRDSAESHWLVEAQYPLIDNFTYYTLRDGHLINTMQGGR